jgi:hypothetical protein
MCGPTAIRGMQGVGLGMSALGAFNGARANQVTLDGQADIAEINARVAESSAQSVLISGQREEQKSRISTANLKGTQRASLAANGVDLGVGSAENILTTTDVLGEIDAQTIKANATASAWGHRTQAVNQQAQARSARAASGAISPVSAMLTTALGGAGQVASSWYQFKRAGAFN